MPLCANAELRRLNREAAVTEHARADVDATDADTRVGPGQA